MARRAQARSLIANVQPIAVDRYLLSGRAMRRGNYLSLCLCAGCVIGVDGSIPALSGGGEPATTSGTDDGEVDDTSATEGSDASTAVGDESAGPSSGVEPASESSGGVTPEGTSEDDGAAQSTGSDDDPPAGPWSSCDGGVPCPEPYGCLGIDRPPEAVCTVACNGDDPTSCPAAPGGTTTPICIVVTGVSVCALDCAAGQSCPNGMECYSQNDDVGPISVCL